MSESQHAAASEQHGRRQIKSNCHYCGYLCGFLATVEDGPQGARLVELAADPSRYPYDERIVNSCRRWRMNLTEIDGAQRVNYPLRRVGERGSGQWQRVSWDEALQDIANKLSNLAVEHGPQTLASAIGGPHASYWPLHRFMNLWGSPNNMGIGQICWNIRIWMDALAYGWPIEVHIDPGVTEQVFLWGTNPAESDNSLFWRTLLRMRKDGVPLVVVDPRRTPTARIASLHLAPRPATDCTLALALIREIIATGRYNRDFVERWCYGFAELVKHVEPYTLALAEQVCGVPASDLAAAAELFSRPGPSALLSGRGIDQLGPATAPTHRALSLLRAICGDVDRPGACYLMDMSDFIPEVDLEMSAALSVEARAAELNKGFSALQSYGGYADATELTSHLGRTAINPEGKRLPMRYLTSAHPNLVWRAMLGEWPGMQPGMQPGTQAVARVQPSEQPGTQARASGDTQLPAADDTQLPAADDTQPKTADDIQPPYRITALICMAANPLVTYADTKLVYRALKNLELLVVLEYYLTPTAQLADYVLPSAGAFERPLIQAHGGVSNFAYGGGAAVEPYYERRCDYDFFRGLGMLLGQEDYWPSATLQEAISATLAPAGVDWQTWMERGIYYNTMTFAKYELPDADGQPQGFATTTGKLELTSVFLEQLGSGRLPQPAVPPPTTPQFPLVLLTGARMQPYWASSYFNNPEFRRVHPYPTAQMSAATLKDLGTKAGEWVIVATDTGEARFMAAEAELLDGVISCEYGWWYPEEPAGEPGLSGIWRSNVNLLTNAAIENCEPLIGSWNYNAIPCRVRRV
ncbi:MAG: molybdopterin-dependent oxidoreductase [Coriobacteriales bacterium]|jgi:anaerobic selenocysteine-containing dehydrogenase|nr:molybdopterin-dependent oxidoreductase [Coriobacteriales bacterium]